MNNNKNQHSNQTLSSVSQGLSATPYGRGKRLQRPPAKLVCFDTPEKTKNKKSTRQSARKGKSATKSTSTPKPKSTRKLKLARKKPDNSNWSPETTQQLSVKKQLNPNQKTAILRPRHGDRRFNITNLECGPIQNSPVLCSAPNGKVYMWRGKVYMCNFDGLEEFFAEKAKKYAISQLHFKPVHMETESFMRRCIQILYEKGEWDDTQASRIVPLLDSIARSAAEQAATNPVASNGIHTTASLVDPPVGSVASANPVTATNPDASASMTELVTAAASAVAVVFKPVLEQQGKTQEQQGTLIEQQAKTLEQQGTLIEQQAKTIERLETLIEAVAAGQKTLAETVAANKVDADTKFKKQDKQNQEFSSAIADLQKQKKTDTKTTPTAASVQKPKKTDVKTTPIAVETGSPDPDETKKKKPSSRAEFDATGVLMWEVKKGPYTE